MDKVKKGGEDALSAHPKILIIADGVGGWATKGIDSGRYSKTLVKKI